MVFPFSRCCSFYNLDEQGRICRGVDFVEMAIKPGKLGVCVQVSGGCDMGSMFWGGGAASGGGSEICRGG